jgi:hypothetical protein
VLPNNSQEIVNASPSNLPNQFQRPTTVSQKLTILMKIVKSNDQQRTAKLKNFHF